MAARAQDSKKRAFDVSAFYDLFLPKRLPDSVNDHLFAVCDEFRKYLWHQSKLHQMNRSFEYISDVSRYNATELHRRIHQLKPDDVIGIFVTQQNASVDFRLLSNGDVIISVYYVASKLNDIYENNISGLGIKSTISPIKRIAVPMKDITLLWTQQLLTLSTKEMSGSLAYSQRGGSQFQETNEVSNPKYVTQWLIGTLVQATTVNNNNSNGIINYIGNNRYGNGTNRIMARDMSIENKKVRDCAIYTKDCPWRRSGAWFGLKQSLHSHFSTIKYKSIIVHFMAVFLRECEKRLTDTQKYEAIVKIERRIKKLKLLAATNNYNGNINEIVGDCKKITENVYYGMQKWWEDRMKSEHTDYKWKKQTGKELITQTFPVYIEKELLQLVENRSNNNNNSVTVNNSTAAATTISVEDSPNWTRMYMLSDIKYLIQFENDVMNETIRLINSIDTIVIPTFRLSLKGCSNVESLYSYFNKYLNATQCKTKYENNPYFKSRLILTTLNVLIMLHMKSNFEYSKDYSFDQYRFPSFIDRIFDKLLYQTKFEVDNVLAIQKYMSKFNSTDAQPRSRKSFMDIGEHQNNYTTPQYSFDIVFGQNNSATVAWLETIQNRYESQKQRKEKEIERTKERYQQLQNEIKQLRQKHCDCYWESDRWRRWKVRCEKHRKIPPKEKKAKKLNVAILEKYLPNNKRLQYAVAFECLMPDLYAQLYVNKY